MLSSIRPFRHFTTNAASRAVWAALVLVNAIVTCTEGRAQTADVIRPFASYAFTYDDNVLGLPNTGSNRTSIGGDLSDMSHTAQGGLLIDKKLGMQYLTGRFEISHTRFDHFRQLDHHAKSVDANWNWHVGQYIDGNLGASYTRSLAPFTDFHQPEKNIRTLQRQDFDARWRFHPSWQVRGGLGKSDVAYDLVSQRSNVREEEYREAAIDYVARSGSTVGMLVRQVTGTYPNPVIIGTTAISNDYEQNEVRGRIDWRSSAKTRLLFSGGAVSRKHSTFSARDFHGTNARLSVDWLATGRLSTSIAVWRELGPVDDLITAYSLNRGVSIAPKLVLTDKIQTDIQFTYEDRNYQQSRAFLPTADFTDTLKSVAWSVHYLPAIRWGVHASLFHNEKDAGKASSSFMRNGASIKLQYQF